jgi:hypothetical protein
MLKTREGLKQSITDAILSNCTDGLVDAKNLLDEHEEIAWRNSFAPLSRSEVNDFRGAIHEAWAALDLADRAARGLR